MGVIHNMRTRSTKPMWVAKVGYIVSALALIVLGLMVLLYPQVSMRTFGMILGILMLVFGAVKLVGYFCKDLYRLAFQHDLLGGILLIVLGAALLVRPEAAVEFFCVVFGILTLCDGLLKLRIATNARKFGIRPWWLIIAEGVLSAILGALVIFRPGSGAQALMILFGLTLLCEGLLNLSVALTTVKIIRTQMPDEPEVRG